MAGGEWDDVDETGRGGMHAGHEITNMVDHEKKRARRISSAEALAWALNLRLNNTIAKFILCVLAQYVDGDGICFVSVNTISEDTELVTQTIRSRLGWLEEIGVIARTAQWIDEFGNRNSTGKGRRTSDNIRLMVALDAVQLEERAKNKSRKNPSEIEGQSDREQDIDPPRHAGSSDMEQDVDPQYLAGSEDGMPPSCPSALPPNCHSNRPSSCVQGLISEHEHEHEHESPPNPPPGDVRASEDDLDVRENEHFVGFWENYPAHEAMERYRALEIFVTMTVEEQIHARAAAPLLAVTLEKLKRRPRDAHKWLATQGWREFPQAKLPPKGIAPARRLIRGNELRAVALAMKIAGLRPLSAVVTKSAEDGRSSEGIFWGREIGPDLLAMAKFEGTDDGQWDVTLEGNPQFAAWRDRLKTWVGTVEPQRIWLEPYIAEVHGLAGSDPAFRPRKSSHGFRVPHPWPPLKDGSWSTAGPPLADLSEQELADFK